MWNLIKSKLLQQSTENADASTNEPQRQEDASVSTAAQNTQLGISNSNVTVAEPIAEKVVDISSEMSQQWKRNENENRTPAQSFLPIMSDFSSKLWKVLE